MVGFQYLIRNIMKPKFLHSQIGHCLVPRLSLCLVILLSLVSFTSQGQDNKLASIQIDWPSFMARHDLKWEELPKAWHEGAFLGNGLVGTMIYAPEKDTLQWDVGRSDVQDRGNRIIIGKFLLQPEAAPQKGQMLLDLWNAEARGTVRLGGNALSWRSLTHADKLVTLIELDHGKAPAPKIIFKHDPAIPAREEFKNIPIPPDQQNPDVRPGNTGNISWCLQSFKAGGGYCVAWGEKALAPGRSLFAFTVDFVPTGEPSSTKAVATIQETLAANFDELICTHRAWWQNYYQQSFLSVPDTRMESFYWIQMYKLGAATRPDRPAIDLLGPWFRRTPWPKIWWNLNIQLTYWPVYTANRLNIGESLNRMLDHGKGNLISNVPPDWRHDSAAIARTSSYDCRGGVGGKDGEERGNLTWTLHNYWLHYRYSGDEAMLRDRLYPLLKRAIAYYLHLLKPGADGRLHLPLSTSPEYPKQAPDTNFDLSLLRWGLQTLLASNERLGLRDEQAARWRETLDKLAPYPVDTKTGYMIGAGVPLSESHRHFSHLFMVYPLHTVDPQSAQDRPLIEKSLDHWIGFEGALQGYSFTGSSAMSSWLGRKEAAVSLLNQFLDRYAKANTMYLESGPVIETPLSAAASLHEILLQSWSMEPFGTDIRVFPAVPDSWRDVTIHKLLTEGAFEISASRRDGKTRFVQVTSRAGAPCRLHTDLPELIRASGAREFKLQTQTDRNGQRVVTVDLRKGETVLLTSAQTTPNPAALVINPVPAQAGRQNFFGSTKSSPVAPDASGNFELTARAARMHGSKLLYQKKPEGESIGRWIEAGDYLSWKVQVKEPGRYQVVITYSSTSAGNSLLLEVLRPQAEEPVQLTTLKWEKQTTGGWEKFKEFPVGTLDFRETG
jgi:hypothetical protein